MDARRRGAGRGTEGMRGFSLLEALVCVALLAGAVLGLTSAVLSSTHATSALLTHQVLTDVASDVLTDLRVTTAYQPEVMASLAAAPPAAFTVERVDAAGDPVEITVTERFVPDPNTAGYDAAVTTRDPVGRAETLGQLVAPQAVAPGSVVTDAPATGASGTSIADPAGAGGPPNDPAAPAAIASGPPPARSSAGPVFCSARAGCLWPGRP